MSSEVAELPISHKLWAWFEANKKQAVYGAVALVLAAVLIGFIAWQRSEKEVTAGEALSDAASPHGPGTSAGAADAYLRVAASYPKTSAGARALLLAASSLFVEGKFPQAQVQFEKFMREHRDSPLLGQALLGIAACLDAQGKTDAAIAAYKDLVSRRPNENIIPQAKFALGRLYEAQGKLDLARTQFEEVAGANPNSSVGSEAGMRLEELKMRLPAVAAPPSVSSPATPTAVVTPTNAVPFKLENR